METNGTLALSAEERHKILVEWNDTRHDYPRDSTIQGLISARAAGAPQKVAVVYDGTSLSYEELELRSNQLANYLRSLGVGLESLVGLYVDRSLEMVVGILGILKAGGAYIPIDSELPDRRVTMMLEDAQPPVILTQASLLERIGDKAAVAVCLDNDWPRIAQESGNQPAVEMSSQNLAYLVYTSGSTGTPKGAQNIHRSIVNLVNSMARRVGITAEDNVLSTTTLSFDPSVWEIFLPLTQGATLTIASREEMMNGALLQKVIDEGGISFLRSTPTGWRLYLESGWQGGHDLKILSGGEKLSQDLAQKLQGKCAALWHTYGPAETAVFCTMGIIPVGAEIITIGRPHDNIQIYLLDENLQPVPVGATGELYIAGDGVGRGYYNRPQLTAERFLPNPFFGTGPFDNPVMYRTGDLAFYTPEGEIVFVGRNDFQVKISGRRIELGDIEAAVGSHPAVAQNLAVARQDKQGELYLVSYLIPERGHKLPGPRLLRQYLRQVLPGYMLPARFVVLERFPVSPNGKIDRLALPDPASTDSELSDEFQAPGNELEVEVAALFAAVLRLDRVSVEDSFFELGGNSLLAARLLYQIADRFNIMVPMGEFFANPDVAALSQIIGARQTVEEPVPDLPAAGLTARPGLPADGHYGVSPELLRLSNLTQNQFLMWMGQQIMPDVPLYNVIHTFTIQGDLDIGAFRAAFQALVDAHDAFRTVFLAVNGVPRQEVLEHVEAPVGLIDYSGSDDPQAAYAAFLDKHKLQMLPMDQQLFESVLIKLFDDRYVWYLCQHHIITDALSAELIFERMSHYYQLALENRLADIPPPPQYADFVRYERDHRQSPEFQKVLAYWREKYSALLPPVSFYGRTSPEPTTEIERVVCDLGAQRSARLREIVMQHEFSFPSVDMALFTIFATLLFTTIHRLNGQQKLRLGTPYHGRPTADALDIIGLFIELGVIQVDIDEGETFVSLAEKVGAEILQNISYVQPGISSADLNRSYDVVINYIQASFNEFAGLPVQKDPVHSGHIDAGHNLRLQITDYHDSGSFLLLFDMKTSLFGASERQWFVDHFLRVVDAFVADHQRRIGDFSLLSSDAYQRLLVDFNDTDAPYPSGETVVQLFEKQVRKTPGHIAAVEGAASITYAELNKHANRLAHFLRSEHGRSLTAVAICMDRSVDVLVAIWGVLKAGGHYLPIDPNYPPGRIAYMLQDAGAEYVLTSGDQSHANLPDGPGMTIVDLSTLDLAAYSTANPEPAAAPDDLVYMIYTSGSTGKAKGALLTHRGLINYVCWAREFYQKDGEILDFPLYSSLAFDLTVTSIFVPLISGGRVIIYGASAETPGLEILSVFADDAVDIVKLTPAHLELVRELNLSAKRIRKLIVGGEDFKTDLALAIHDLFKGRVEMYNEYGPTETVVGCMIHHFDPQADTAVSVPIGRPVANTRIYLLDAYDQPVPPGVAGEMVISGVGVGHGYHQRPQLTAERFGSDPFRHGARFYRTGDSARWDEEHAMVFLGRLDHQVKIGGARIELGEIEAALREHPAVQDVVVSVVQFVDRPDVNEIVNCKRCGLPSNYPDVTFNKEGICSICTDFDAFRDDVSQYFKTMDDLNVIVERAKAERSGQYDCMMLYSGGKDSTYVLGRLVEMGLNVLAFSLDNGYISQEALDNVRRVTDHLGVDLVISRTPHMNAIFADSLERFSNVCQGCYKTIYTLSMKLARERGIRYIFTGLSRGQLFETRLDELFRNRLFDVEQMDQAVIEARKVYHSVDDAVYRLLDVSMFRDERIFKDITFVDFFRYTDVELDDLYDFLSTRVPWIRPRDTGRSTNCLINEAGIFVHKTERGYHNYALPYSWDVRLGHKTREEALEELDDDIRMPVVRQMLDEVGYTVKDWQAGKTDKKLAAYFASNEPNLTVADLRGHLAQRLPAYMIPAYFVGLEAIPLTPNGKVNRQDLPNPAEKRPEIDAAFVGPQSQLELALADIWSQVLNVKRIGIHDDFFELGGASIPAVQTVVRISDQFEVDFPVRAFFEHPTIAGQSALLEELLVTQLEEMSDEEIERLLVQMGD